jgi:hypothetical protein
VSSVAASAATGQGDAISLCDCVFPTHRRKSSKDAVMEPLHLKDREL